MALEKILLVSEDQELPICLGALCEQSGKELLTACSALQALELMKHTQVDLLLCDLELTEISGMDLFQIIKQLYPTLILVVICSKMQIEKALSCIRLGAFQYLVKPLCAKELEMSLEKAGQQIRLLQENEFLRKEISYSSKTDTLPFIAKSPQMKQILSDVMKIAQSQASVFINGESGTGKEVIAGAIHRLSPRAQRPFIRVNCAAIAESLLESEFFGHEKGAFTGAIQKKPGRFELADKGTLLLDEISEIPLELQPKLLRAIQEKEFERVGGTKPLQVDVRILSTSNRSMKEAIQNKLFREDLYFRLNVVPIHIPPLRERKEDILALAHHFLEKLCKDNGKPLKHLCPSAEDRLLSYDWPGNARELANIMERTLVMHSKDQILADDLFIEFSCPVPPPVSIYPQAKTLADVEKHHILTTLRALGNNKTQAAKSLGISLRTLRNKLKVFH